MSDPSSNRAPTPRRVSHRRYLVRRAAVAGVVVLAGFGVVRAAGALADGGGDSGAIGDVEVTVPPTASGSEPEPEPEPIEPTVAATTTEITSDTEEVPEPTEPPATTVPPVTVAATTAVATTVAPTTPPSTGPPSAADPASVLVVGDSFAGLWGPPLAATLDETGIVQTEVDYRMGTGLARPTEFDWFAQVLRQFQSGLPDIIVTSFGGNDFTGIVDGDGSPVVGDPITNQEAWLSAYEARAGTMMDLLGADGRTVIWVGTANHPDNTTSVGLALQDKAAKAAAAQRPGVVFVDVWDLLAGRDGGWAANIIDPRDGQGKEVRMADGFHPNEVGSEIIADAVAARIRDALIARGAVL